MNKNFQFLTGGIFGFFLPALRQASRKQTTVCIMLTGQVFLFGPRFVIFLNAVCVCVCVLPLHGTCGHVGNFASKIYSRFQFLRSLLLSRLFDCNR